ncbi:MAG: hypothetical protein ACPL5F_00425 [Moorellaceae bacterium]
MRLRRNVPSPEGYEHPVDLDHLDRFPGEYSHMAIVHIDGNDMGERKKKIGLLVQFIMSPEAAGVGLNIT